MAAVAVRLAGRSDPSTEATQPKERPGSLNPVSSALTIRHTHRRHPPLIEGDIFGKEFTSAMTQAIALSLRAQTPGCFSSKEGIWQKERLAGKALFCCTLAT